MLKILTSEEVCSAPNKHFIEKTEIYVLGCMIVYD